MNFITPPFSSILNDVDSIRSLAQEGNIDWFAAEDLRRDVFLTVASCLNAGEDDIAKVVKGIWMACIYTAPMALTLIAPVESYKSKEDAILNLTVNDKDVIESIPDIEVGVDNLERTLSQPVCEKEGFSILCNLYSGSHVFVIEKRSARECFIYQSNLTFGESYNFQEFLADPEMQLPLTPEKIIKRLRKIISSSTPNEKRIRNYEKLFFICDLIDFEIKQRLYKCPLTFVTTTHYLLRSS